MGEPTFDALNSRQPHAGADGFSARPLPSPPPGFVIRAAGRLHRVLLRLAGLLLPAEVALRDRSYGVATTHLLGAAARHRVADVLEEGPLTAEEIAKHTGTDADAMHRTLRALALVGVFTLDGNGRFGNNRLSRTLRSGNPARVRDFAEHMATAACCAAWSDYDHTLRTGATAFDHANGMGMWDWFGLHPEEEETFAQAMMGVTIPAAPVVATTYPFEEVSRVCDVGGGRGTLLAELLVRHPHLRGVLCDSPAVIDSARPLLAQRGVADRVELVAGSFFESVPPGCDAYILKHVLHDWDDARCGRILDTCRSAMRPGSRVLLVELSTEKNEVSFAALLDVQMMIHCGGRERSGAELGSLLRNSGFRTARVFRTPMLSIIEGIAD
jgi:hypothetical protein